MEFMNAISWNSSEAKEAKCQPQQMREAGVVVNVDTLSIGDRTFLLPKQSEVKTFEATFGPVWKADELEYVDGSFFRTGCKFAIKQINKECAKVGIPLKLVNTAGVDSLRGVDSAKAEMEALQHISHLPSEATLKMELGYSPVQKLTEVGEDETCFYVVTQWIGDAPLFEVLRIGFVVKQRVGDIKRIEKEIGCSNIDILQWIKTTFWQLCKGVQHIHASGWCHLDVSSENIIMEEVSEESTYRPHLIDFGQARRQAGATKLRPVGQIGRMACMAPEIYENDRMYDGPAADVWSLGILLLELLTGRRPFKSSSDEDRNFAILQLHGVSQLCKTNQWSLPAEAIDILSKLLHPDPNRRISMAKLVDLAQNWMEQGNARWLGSWRTPQPRQAPRSAPAFQFAGLIKEEDLMLEVEHMTKTITSKFTHRLAREALWTRFLAHYAAMLGEGDDNLAQRARQYNMVWPGFTTLEESCRKFPSRSTSFSVSAFTVSTNEIQPYQEFVEPGWRDCQIGWAETQGVNAVRFVGGALWRSGNRKALVEFVAATTIPEEMVRVACVRHEYLKDSQEQWLEPRLNATSFVLVSQQSISACRLRTRVFLQECTALSTYVSSALFVQKLWVFYQRPVPMLIVDAAALGCLVVLQLLALAMFGIPRLIHHSDPAASLMYFPFFSAVAALVLPPWKIVRELQLKAKFRVLTILLYYVPSALVAVIFSYTEEFTPSGVLLAAFSVFSVIGDIFATVSVLDNESSRSPGELLLQ